jgi:hypothetical protein
MGTTGNGAGQVKRIIRCRSTQKYLSRDGWTFDPNSAQSFDRVIDAARVCLDRGLANVELVLHLSDARAEPLVTGLLPSRPGLAGRTWI